MDTIDLTPEQITELENKLLEIKITLGIGEAESILFAKSHAMVKMIIGEMSLELYIKFIRYILAFNEAVLEVKERNNVSDKSPMG